MAAFERILSGIPEMDAYSDAEHAYIRPLKVWNRFSDTMFLPHFYMQMFFDLRENKNALSQSSGRTKCPWYHLNSGLLPHSFSRITVGHR